MKQITNEYLYRYKSGYFTVEAALILPIVLLFLTTMLFMGFYSYDRCILEQSACEAALRGSSNRFSTQEEAYAETESAAQSLLTEKVFAASGLKYTVTVSQKDVTVSYECCVNVPFLSWLSEYLENVDFSIYVTKTVPRSRPVESIRLFRRISGNVKQGLG